MVAQHLHWWPRLFVTVLVTLGCAWLSWHLIEKQALRLKPRGTRINDVINREAAPVAAEPAR